MDTLYIVCRLDSLHIEWSGTGEGRHGELLASRVGQASSSHEQARRGAFVLKRLGEGYVVRYTALSLHARLT